MKFLCACGKTSSDNTDFLPYKGYLISDLDWFPCQEEIVEELGAFLRAKLEGDTVSFLTQHFSADYAKLNLPDAGVLSDIVGRHLLKATVTTYQCVDCKRLFVSSLLKKRYFHTFVPEEPVVDIFKKPSDGLKD